MENLQKIVLEKIDLSLPFFSMYEKFLVQWDEDPELEEALKEVKVADIEQVFMKLYETYYLPDTKIVEKETIFDEFIGYNEHNLVYAKTKKAEHIIFNTTTGVILSKTSMERLLKKYTIDDITRVRLYCMFHNHTRPDDDFITNLDKMNVKWKTLKIKNPMRMWARFPKISV